MRHPISRATCLLLTVATMLSPDASPARQRLGAPLAHLPGLVASFGEYRTDHLHPGVDFSTSGRTGLPVRAVADGEIYRLKIEWRGYGRALYLRHPDGRVSVYAHLERYENRRFELERRVEEDKRRRNVRYPGDILLEPPIAVKKGEIVGYSGESGVGLPHLHFEIRRNDQEPVDPLEPGWLPAGLGKGPVFESLIFRSDAPETWIEGVRISEVGLALGKDGVYAPPRPVILTGPFLSEARVYSEEEGHRVGVRALTVWLDGVTTYQFRIASFHFSDYPKVGLLLDHARSRISPSSYAYFLVRLPGNDLGKVPGEQAWPPIAPGTHRLEVEAVGPRGETSRALIPFLMAPGLLPSWDPPGPDLLRHAFRFGASRSELGSEWQVVYTVLGQGAALPCHDRSELADGEVCRFELPPRSGGITARLYRGPLLLGRATLFLPLGQDGVPVPPPATVDPFRNFVDIHLRVAPEVGGPSKILVISRGGTSRYNLVEEGSGRFLGILPASAWEKADVVDVEWEDPVKPRRAVLPLFPRFADPAGSVRIDGCGAQLDVEPGSFYTSAPIGCEPMDAPLPMEKGLEILGRPVQFLPEGLPLARKALLAFDRPAGDPDPGRFGIYRFDPFQRRWIYQGGDVVGGKVVLPVGRFDAFALLRDNSRPRVLGLDPSGAQRPMTEHPVFRVKVEDQGSGLNYDGVHLILDGLELESEFDPDRGWAVASPAGPLTPGIHSGTAWAVDRSGNRSEAVSFKVRVR